MQNCSQKSGGSVFSLVPVSDATLEFVRKLRNNPLDASAFVNNNYITPENHAIYMAQHMDKYFVCYYNEILVGFIGVVENDIRLAVTPDFRNQGVAKYMVSEIMFRFPDAHAKVKVTNGASIALFESLGFERVFYIYESGK
jgi:ribosomal protein S18 acetylase RimI-like enzyme